MKKYNIQRKNNKMKIIYMAIPFLEMGRTQTEHCYNRIQNTAITDKKYLRKR